MYIHGVNPGDLYRHYKGRLYRIIAIALHEASLSPQVVYQDVVTGAAWTRDLSNFLSLVHSYNGNTLVARFTLVTDNEFLKYLLSERIK